MSLLVFGSGRHTELHKMLSISGIKLEPVRESLNESEKIVRVLMDLIYRSVTISLW